MAGNVDEHEIRIVAGEEWVVDKTTPIQAPCCTTLRCSPCCDKCCKCSKCCYNGCDACSCCAWCGACSPCCRNCCGKGCWNCSPCCPFCYYCFPCFCCCCRPVIATKKSDLPKKGRGAEIIYTGVADDTASTTGGGQIAAVSDLGGIAEKKAELKAEPKAEPEEKQAEPEAAGGAVVAPEGEVETVTGEVGGEEAEGEGEVEVGGEEEKEVEEVVEEAPSKVEEGAQAKAPQKVAAKKRQAVKLKPASKTKPKVFTGAAGGSRPAKAEECEGPPPEPQAGDMAAVESKLGMGAYLVYNEEKGGHLYIQWSKEPMKGSGILAYIKPNKNVGDFKFKQSGGKVSLADNVVKNMQSSFPADRKKYYSGHVKFLKLAADFDGEILLLPSMDLQPPPKTQIIIFHKNHVEKMELGKFYKKDTISSVGAIPSTSTTFQKMQNTELSIFNQHADNEGATTSFSAK